MRWVLTAVMGALALAAFSLPSVQAAPQGAQAETSQQFKEETLDRFVNARVEIVRIRNRYHKAIQEAGKAEKRQLKQQVVQDMRQAIKDQGLSLNKYYQVAKQANQEALQKKLHSRMQAVQGNQ